MVLAATLAGASLAYAQEPAAAPAAPAAPVLPLEGDAVMITMLIKPDQTATFESVIAKYKEAFSKSEKPVRKEQLAGMKFFKSPTAGPNGNAIYVFYVDPVIKGEEYDISRVIAEVFPVEVQEIFEKYKASFAGRGITNLNKLQ